MSDEKQLAELLAIEEKYAMLREAIAELGQYAQGLADMSKADAMVVWLMKEHNELIARAFAAYAYSVESRRLYTDLLAEHADLLTAIDEADDENPAIADLIETARNDGEKYALTGVILRIAAAQGIANSDVSQLLNALEHPDRVSPFIAPRLADRLREIADGLDTQTTEQVS